MHLEGKKILLGVCGSIAAYKALILLRLLVKAGAAVQVIMTKEAQQFVGKLSFSSLTDYPVFSELAVEDNWKNHVDLGLWADVMVIAPATANTMSKLAHGIVDNLLTAVYLSSKCPVMIGPAMDLDMWAHPATKRNIRTLQSDGVQIFPVGFGPLASGLIGDGRLAEPENMFQTISDYFNHSKDLEGKKLLITAGPTIEAIDPVRFISNHSSGKMGIKIAEAALIRGAEVTLILGPTKETVTEHKNLELIRVSTAEQMLIEVKKKWINVNYFILAAAVSDYQAREIAQEKIKKDENNLSLELKRTVDIAAFIGENKADDQILIGFALETENIMDNAQKKLDKKNMNMIVINSPKVENSAFGYDTNKIDILKKNGEYLSFELKSKKEVAEDILNEMLKLKN